MYIQYVLLAIDKKFDAIIHLQMVSDSFPQKDIFLNQKTSLKSKSLFSPNLCNCKQFPYQQIEVIFSTVEKKVMFLK